MNEILNMLGVSAWKPVLSALLLPPVPFFLLILVGARLILPRRGLGWTILLIALLATWLSLCAGTGRLLETYVRPLPKPLPEQRLLALAQEGAAASKAGRKPSQGPRTAIVVLGGGREGYAPEYGTSNLQSESLERLRYGVHLAKATGLPLAFSGGVGWSQGEGLSEAAIAQDVATRDFQVPLKWVEEESRDTVENARNTLRLLKPQGITHIVLVTHGYHMRRALKHFEAEGGNEVTIEPAAMGLVKRVHGPNLDWLPSHHGYQQVRRLCREMLGQAMGA